MNLAFAIASFGPYGTGRMPSSTGKDMIASGAWNRVGKQHYRHVSGREVRQDTNTRLWCVEPKDPRYPHSSDCYVALWVARHEVERRAEEAGDSWKPEDKVLRGLSGAVATSARPWTLELDGRDVATFRTWEEATEALNAWVARLARAGGGTAKAHWKALDRLRVLHGTGRKMPAGAVGLAGRYS